MRRPLPELSVKTHEDGEEVVGDDATIGTTNLPAPPEDPGQFILYQTEDGQTRAEVRIFRETVWLSQKAMAELFQKNARTINECARNVLSEGQLREETVIWESRRTRPWATQHPPRWTECWRFG